jgi:uncharacterized lipoprotein YmbA
MHSTEVPAMVLGVLAAAIAFSAGCIGTPNSRYFTLDLAPSANHVTDWQVEVEQIRLSDALTRPALVVETGATELEYYNNARWASSLEELVNEKLRAELVSLGRVEHRLRMRGKLLNFAENEAEAETRAHVRLYAEFWRESAPRFSPPDFQKSYEAFVLVGEDNLSAIAAALSRGLEQIASEIRQDIEQFLSAQDNAESETNSPDLN